LPTITREEYFATTIFSHRYQPEMTGLFQALLQRPEVDSTLLNQLEAILNARKEELK
jgi:hypothetical protein